MVLGPNSLLVAARVDFANGRDEDEVERVSEETTSGSAMSIPM